MSDDIGSGSVTDCLLRSFSNLKGQTQQCRAALWQKSKQKEKENKCKEKNKVQVK